MNKLTIKNQNEIYELLINDYKIIFGNNYEKKDCIIRTLEGYFAKTGASEYLIEMDKKIDLLWNDSYLRINDFEFIKISSDFDISQDLKMQTKSLTIKAIESYLDTFELSDAYQSLSIGFFHTVDEINDELSDYFLNRTVLNLTSSFSKKSLIKLLSANLLIEECDTNNFDYTINDRINYQLVLTKIICDKLNKKCILLINSPIISEENYKLIESIKAFKIIISNDFKDFDYDNYYITEDISIDLSNEEELYNYCMESSMYTSIEETKKALINKYIEK